MKTTKLRVGRFALCLLMGASAYGGRAATIWNGPNITYTKSGATPSDTIVPGKVVLKRNNSGVLYNTAASESSPGTTSPKDTLWAFGQLPDFATLTYKSMDAWRNGNLSLRIVNQPVVVHLVNEDIYFSIKFTTWGMHGAGTVSYSRSTAPPSPTVSISSPASGAVFAAPATISLTSTATVTGGTVTNVEYFAGTTSLGHATASPFSVEGNFPTAGAFALKAVATAGGITSTSTAVNITVVAPVDVTLTTPSIGGGLISFSYAADPGLRYVIQWAADVDSPASWVSILTNTPSSTPAAYSEPFSLDKAARFFRVGRLPNP